MIMKISKIAFNHLGFVATRDNELAKSPSRIEMHNVPEYWTATDLHHRLRDYRGLLCQPGSKTAGQNDSSHGIRFPVRVDDKDVLFMYTATVTEDAKRRLVLVLAERNECANFVIARMAFP